VRALGVTVGVGEQFEPLPIDEPSSILGTDSELGERDRGYLPRRVLADRTTRRTLELGLAGRFDVNVPTPSALLFMKLKAFHDRGLAWQALRDPTIMARIPPGDRPQVRAKDVSYYARKAGKDLYDVAFLAAHHNALDAALAIASEEGLDGDLTPILAASAEPLRIFGQEMATAEGDEPTRAWISALRGNAR